MYISNNTTIKWENSGEMYCLHIQSDDNSESPREWDDLTTMACWHRNYSLGDSLDDQSAEEFWRRLVSEHVHNLSELASNGKIPNIRIAANTEDSSRFDIFETASILNQCHLLKELLRFRTA